MEKISLPNYQSDSEGIFCANVWSLWNSPSNPLVVIISPLLTIVKDQVKLLG